MQKIIFTAALLVTAACATNNPKTAEDYNNNQKYCGASAGLAALNVINTAATGAGNIKVDTRCLNPNFTGVNKKQ